MPKVTTNNFQLVYTLNSHGHDVTNTLAFPNERSMVAYAKRLHNANPITWNVVEFQKKDDNGNWTRNDTAHSSYNKLNQPVIKKTDVLMVHPLMHLSTLALSLSRIAAKRELNPQERQNLIEATGNVAQLIVPFGLEQLQNIMLETTGKAVQETTQLATGNFEAASPVMDESQYGVVLDHAFEEQPKRKDKGLFSRK